MYLTSNWLWITEGNSSLLRLGGNGGLLSMSEGDCTVTKLRNRWFYLREGSTAILRLKEWMFLREGSAWIVRLCSFALCGQGWSIQLKHLPP